jgi:predicted enzyme related to lactoylglutathione lyase
MTEQSIQENNLKELKMKTLNEVKGVAEVSIKVSNVSRSVEWYVSNLGCEIRQQHDGYAILILPWGPDLGLLSQDKLNDMERSQRLFLYAPNVEKYHNLLKENGVKVDEITDGEGCGRGFSMFDPDGTQIGVWEAMQEIEGVTRTIG